MEWIIPPKYDFEIGWTFDNGLSQVRENGKWGLIDMSGNIVVPFKSQGGINFFGENLVHLNIDGKYGIYTFDGVEVLPAIYRGAQANHNQSGCILDSGSYEDFVNAKGVIVNKPKTIRDFTTNSFSEGLISVEKWKDNGGTEYGYMDEQGEFPLPMMFKYNKGFYNGIAGTSNHDGGKRLYINKKGETIFSCPDNWLGVDSFNGRYAMVHLDKGLLGLINQNFEFVFEPTTWGSYSGHNDDLLFISKQFTDASYSGVLDTNGEIIVPFKYKPWGVSQLSNKYFIVSKHFFVKDYENREKMWDYENVYTKCSIFDIDKQTEILPFEYDDLSKATEDVIIATKDKKTACLDFDFNLVLPFEFEKINRFIDRKTWAKQDGKWGLLKV